MHRSRSARCFLEPGPSHANTWWATVGNLATAAFWLWMHRQMQRWPEPYVFLKAAAPSFYCAEPKCLIYLLAPRCLR